MDSDRQLDRQICVDRFEQAGKIIPLFCPIIYLYEMTPFLSMKWPLSVYEMTPCFTI